MKNNILLLTLVSFVIALSGVSLKANSLKVSSFEMQGIELNIQGLILPFM